MLKEASGLEVVDLEAEALASVEEQRTSAAAAEENRSATARGFLFDAELTTDGLADLVSYEALYRLEDDWAELESVELKAHRGTDGQLLWSRDVPQVDAEMFLIQFPDVNGDNADDIGLLTVEYEQWWTPSQWQFALVSGSDGLTLWDQTYERRSETIQALGHYETTVSAFAVVPIFVDDQNGDALPDVLVEEVSMVYVMDRARVAVVDRYGDSQRSSTKASILNGSNGAPIDALAYESQTQVSLLVPSGQSVGDETQDLVWIPVAPLAEASDELCVSSQCMPTPQVSEPSNEFSVEMIDGATHQMAWRTNIPKTEFTWPLAVPGKDFDGDGSADLFEMNRWMEHGSYASWPLGLSSLTLMRGVDGGSGWTVEFEESEWAWFSLNFGLVDDQPGNDLLTFRYTDAGEKIERRSGRTGDEFATSFASGWADLSLLPDANGDARADLMISSWAWGDEGGHVRVENGFDATLIFEKATDAENLYGFGDADGDGTTDLIAIRQDYHRRSVDVTLTVVSMPNGETLWNSTRSIHLDEYGILYPISDANGGQGTDLLWEKHRTIWGSEQIEEVRSALELTIGTDGAVSFSIGDPMGSPPPVGTGSISGKVIGDAGTPLEGICVYPDSDQFGISSPSVTDSSGSFEIAELEAGAHWLKLVDCYGGRYRSEWFENQSERSAATPITLSEDENLLLTADIGVELLPPPVNDHFADALDIADLSFTDIRNIVDATSEPFEENFCWNEKSIWYRFTPTQPVTVKTVLRDAGWDVSIGWITERDGNLVEHECGVGEARNGDSYNIADLEAGTTYYLRLAVSEWSSRSIDLVFEQL
jgi:hypothetical protein